MSCCATTVGGINTVTIEMTDVQQKSLIDIYAKGAALRVSIRQSMTRKIATPDTPLPLEYRLTTAGCNNNHQMKISAMINSVYAIVRNVAAEQQITLDGRFTQTQIYRLDATSVGDTFGFNFSSTKDGLSVIVIPKIYPKYGVLIEKICRDQNQWGVYHNGAGGTFEQEIKPNSKDCGWVAPLKGGTVVNKECRGFDQWGEYNDGNYGTYFQQIKENSTACGYVPPPKAGTSIGKECVGVDQWGIYADGTGGTTRSIIKENSTACGYKAPAAGGTLIRMECQGTTYTRVESDGQGGQRSVPSETNSKRCGGTGSGSGTPNPNPSPSPPGPPPGTEPAGEHQKVCYNGALMWAQLMVNGEYTFTFIQNNHPTCLTWQRDPAKGNGIWDFPSGDPWSGG